MLSNLLVSCTANANDAWNCSSDILKKILLWGRKMIIDWIWRMMRFVERKKKFKWFDEFTKIAYFFLHMLRQIKFESLRCNLRRTFFYRLQIVSFSLKILMRNFCSIFFPPCRLLVPLMIQISVEISFK